MVGHLAFLLILFNILIFGHSLYEGCDFLYRMNIKGSFRIKTHKPKHQIANESCRYVVKAPIDYHVKVSCTIIINGAESACKNNYLFISTTGEKNLAGGDVFCGNETVVKTSLFQSLAVAYHVNQLFRINCLLTPEKETPENCECGWSTSQRIVSGQKAGALEFPSIVGLVVVNDPKKPCNGSCRNSEGIGQYEIYCGGTIISHNYVLSVATCIIWYKPPGILKVVVGQYHTDIGHKSKYSQQIFVKSWKLLKTNVYYLSLLKLKAPIEWSLGVGPACLPYNFKDYNFVGQTLIMAGWGTVGANASRSANLLKAQVPVITNEQCQSIMSDVYSDEICTYGPPSGACLQDTGGPLIYQKNRQYFIGIIGYRHECGEISKAGVNVRVSSFLDWIDQNVDDKLCRRVS